MKNVKGILYRGKYDHPLKMWFSMVPESNIYIMIKEEFKTESTWAKLRSFLTGMLNLFLLLRFMDSEILGPLYVFA